MGSYGSEASCRRRQWSVLVIRCANSIGTVFIYMSGIVTTSVSMSVCISKPRSQMGESVLLCASADLHLAG
jgi:hypothetical protein